MAVRSETRRAAPCTPNRRDPTPFYRPGSPDCGCVSGRLARGRSGSARVRRSHPAGAVRHRGQQHERHPTVTISSVDMTKSVLIFQARSNSNRPGGTMVRGRLTSATTIEFERVTDDVPAGVVVNIQWYIATFGSGVFVQRGETTQSATTRTWRSPRSPPSPGLRPLLENAGRDRQLLGLGRRPIVGEMTSPTQVTFRSNAAECRRHHRVAGRAVHERRRHQRPEGLDHDDDRRDDSP